MAASLVKGNRYKRADFGIKWPRSLFGSAEVGGEIYLFVNIGGFYHNHYDEKTKTVIHEPHSASEVVNQDIPPAKTTRVFIRDLYKKEKDFEYIGDNFVIKHNDPRRNCLYVK